MRISDLQKKDIININDGTKIGNIVDVKINESNGAVDALVVERSGFSFNIFSQRGELDILFLLILIYDICIKKVPIYFLILQ